MITSKQINVNNRKVAIFIVGPVCFLIGASSFILAFLNANNKITSSIVKGISAGLIFSIIMIYYAVKKWKKTVSDVKIETEKKNYKKYQSISLIIGLIIVFFLGQNTQLEIFILSVMAGLIIPLSVMHILKAILRKEVFQKEVPGLFNE